MMGGQIGLEHREGGGSTFWFTAVFTTQSTVTAAAEPGSRPRIPAQARIEGVLDPPDAAKEPNRELRLLLAEDNPVNRMVALAQLKKLGYAVDAVDDGVQVVAALERRPYDLVLMDCEMPNMDGYEATQRIRGSTSRHIPIVALTANAMSGDRERCLSEGMDDFLSKPLDLRLLRETLAKWLATTR
jgi:CheY-like chemotaxis protein